MQARIESAVRVTTRQSEKALNASEAATASISRDEATGSFWPLKPATPVDRVMAGVLLSAGESPESTNSLASTAGNIAAV